MKFYPQERLALIVDGPSLWHTAKSLAFEIDYARLRGFYESEGVLIRCLYFTPMGDTEDFNPVRPLVDWLDFNGWQVTTNPPRVWNDAQGRRHVTGDFEVELAVAMLEMVPAVDHFILATGEATYIPAVEAVQRQGKRVTVLSTIKSAPPCCSGDLRRAADGFVDLANIAAAITRTTKSKELVRA